MPRRATSTSFGAERGNKPAAKGVPAGNAYHQFKLAMQRRAADAKTLKRLDEALAAKEDQTFLKAFAEVSDRGFGRAQQSLDVTSDGEKVAGLLVIPPET